MRVTATMHDDLVIGRTTGASAVGVVIPPALQRVPDRYLRCDRQAFIDIRGLVRAWYIDPQGRPRLDPAPDRRPLTCAGDDPLVRDAASGDWRVAEEVDERVAAIARDLATADALIGRLRRALVTVSDGQAEVYAAKQAEVRAWERAGAPAEADPALHPWAADRAALLAAENTGATAATAITDVLADWQARRDAATAILRAAERARETAKHRIRAAAGPAEAQAILAALRAVCAPLAERLAARSAAGLPPEAAPETAPETAPDITAVAAALDGIAWP